jgi:hypothetical protein
MQLWQKLYGTVWLAFFSCVLVPRWMGTYAGLPVHVLLGLILLVAAQGTAKRLSALPVPPRLKRISKVTLGFAIFQIVSGAALGSVMYWLPNRTVILAMIRVAHVVSALALLAQTSSVATAYDMWEEGEFGAELTPPEAGAH